MNKIGYILVALLALTGCSEEGEYRTIEAGMLGTTMRITSDSPISEQELLTRAMELDSTLKAEMSIFDDSSLLSRINRGEESRLTEALIYNISLADSISRLSDGVYDITVMPLVRAWGFAREDAQSSPNIDSLLEFVGYEKIRVEGDSLVRSDQRVQIDLNSIAKGYGVDCLARLVEASGAENYLVDIGGEIMCRGVNRAGNPWRIGIETPFDGNISNGDYLQARISIGGDRPLTAMATSGNYRRYYLTDSGEKVAHTINPKTGESITSTLLSVTVIAHSCAEADAIATMLLAMGDKGAVDMLTSLDGVEGYLIFGSADGYSHYITDGMRERVMD